MFSVVIPLYNKEKSIVDTVQSVLSQTFSDFELIVVNDGSTDTSRDMVAGFDDKRIRIIDKLNGGISSTRNAGIAAATREHIAFLDADDLWEPDFLSTIELLIRDFPQADCYATGYSCIYNAEVFNVFGVKERGIVTDFFNQVFVAPIMHSSSVCIKKAAFSKVGNFNTSISRGEDYDMWARLGRSTIIVATPESKARYRLNVENSAMAKLPEPKSLWLHYIPADSITRRDEKRYYRRFLHRQVLEYLVKGKFKWAWEIASKNRKIADWYTYFLIPASFQKRQFYSFAKVLKKRFSK